MNKKSTTSQCNKKFPCHNIQEALGKDHYNCIRFFSEDVNKNNAPLKYAISENKYKSVKLLLELGAVPYKCILCDAVPDKDPKIIKCLLMNGADPNDELDCSEFKTVIEEVFDNYFDEDFKEDNIHLIKLLVQYGAKGSFDEEYFFSKGWKHDYMAKDRSKIIEIIKGITPFEGAEYVLRTDEIKEPSEA